MGPFVARIRRKLTQLCPLPTDTWPAWTLQRRCKVQYPPEYRDAVQTGQGLTKKNGLELPSRLTQIWCPGPDSNRHSFRYHPLKMACLPVSPPGQHSLLEVRELRLPTLAFATCRFFNTRRSFSWRLTGFLNCRNTGLTCHFSTLLGEDCQRKTCHKKHNRHKRGQTGQKAATTLTTEHGLGGTATESSTGICTLTLLDKDQTHQSHGDHDVNNDYQCFHPIHTDSRKRFNLRTHRKRTADTYKIFSLKGSTTYKTAINIGLCKQSGRIIRFYTAAVKY